jgi:hypothetical protein
MSEMCTFTMNAFSIQMAAIKYDSKKENNLNFKYVNI